VQSIKNGDVVRDAWLGHYEMLKTRIEKSREAIAASLQKPTTAP